jgi:outer membrane receptor protein involved in Fe transport
MTAAAMPASAQAPPPAPAPAPKAPPPSLSPQELAEIQGALGADKAAVPTAPPPSVPIPGPIARAVQSMNPSISFIADFALAGFSSKSLQMGGHDPYQNGFNLQALEMSASADVDPYFKFDAHIVFGHDGVEVEEAYATTSALPGNLQVRAGQFLTRFGRINPTHPHAWDFVDQPLVIGKMLGGDGNRGLGAEVSWLMPLPWYTELVVSETQATGGCCARSFYGDTDLGVKSPKDLETTLALKQFHALTSDWSLSLGLSAALGPNPTYRGAESYVLGADLYLKYRPISRESSTMVTLTAEALTRRRETPTGTLADSGLYAQVAWRFAQRWTTGARYDFVSGARGDYLDPDWISARHRATADLTFYPTEFSRLRVQGSADVPTWQTTHIYAAFLALEVAVGAHGAHPF